MDQVTSLRLRIFAFRWISRTDFRYDAYYIGMLCFGDNIERKFN